MSIGNVAIDQLPRTPVLHSSFLILSLITCILEPPSLQTSSTRIKLDDCAATTFSDGAWLERKFGQTTYLYTNDQRVSVFQTITNGCGSGASFINRRTVAEHWCFATQVQRSFATQRCSQSSCDQLSFVSRISSHYFSTAILLVQ